METRKFPQDSEIIWLVSIYYDSYFLLIIYKLQVIKQMQAISVELV